MTPTLKYERQKSLEGFRYVVGSDEVGRGSLAGPVVAAAVILDVEALEERRYGPLIRKIRDSKLLTHKQRVELAPQIQQYAVAWGMGEVSHERIDEINIHHASLEAMEAAVKSVLIKITLQPEEYCLALDGIFTIPNFLPAQHAIIDGDASILSIAAASILAKVYRDYIMEQLHLQYPEYGFSDNKGYATKTHRAAILKLGVTPIHRKSFCSQYVSV